ncbi:MAG: sulfatase-like hydrolase/transferase, partial [Pseudomonadota bacterium]
SGYAAAPVCSPTRYSILYGQTCARLRKTLVRGPNLVDHTQLSLPQAIKRADARYVCAHFGKWHIAVEPETVGFDVSDGKTTNREGGFNNGKAVEWSGYAADDPKLVDHVTDRGIAFMREQVRAGRPFFLQLSHYAVHSDIVFRESTLREVERWPRGRTHQHAGYAAMIKDLDDAVGRLMRAFDDLNLADNTYVFFVSDNGGMPMIPPKRRDGVPYERALNAPLRSGKWDLTEGGLRVPFFVAGPGIAAGIQCDTPVVTYDLLPTFTDIAGASAFTSPTLDGASLLPLLHDPRSASVKRPLGDTLVFHFPHYNRMGPGGSPSAARRGPCGCSVGSETRACRPAGASRKRSAGRGAAG